MSASLTADTINQGLSYGALAAVIAGVPPEVALGSLAGAVIFVTSAVEYPVKRRVLLALLSFLCGLLFYTGLVRAGHCLLRRRVRCRNCRGAGWDMAVSPL